MKTRMNVTKKEAEQLGWNAEFIRTDNAHFSIKDSSFVFWSGNGGACGILNHKNKYKDYEWRLTDLKDLEKGNIIKCIYQSNNFTEIGVFDEYAIFWTIESNRPKKQIICTNKALELVYKLCKKSDKK